MYQTVYTFDGYGFLADLEALIVKDGVLQEDILLAKAVEVVNNASETLLKILDRMHYGEYWLEDPEDPDPEPGLWFLIVLASVLEPAPALNLNRNKKSYYVLEAILPVAGWSDEEVKELFFGKRLCVLLQAYGNELFTRAFISYAWDGYLSLDDVKRLRTRLQSSQDYFSPSSGVSIELIQKRGLPKYAGAPSQEPTVILENAYADATDMLQAAIDREKDLLIILE